MKMDLMKKKKKKGFTLIELIVVIAIIGVLAAIAIPRFSGMQGSAQVKAEGATAAQIVSAARIQETENNGTKVSLLVQTTTATANNPSTDVTTSGTLFKKYITVPTSPTFTITGGGSDAYVVSWNSTANGYVGAQSYTENSIFGPVAH